MWASLRLTGAKARRCFCMPLLFQALVKHWSAIACLSALARTGKPSLPARLVSVCIHIGLFISGRLPGQPKSGAEDLYDLFTGQQSIQGMVVGGCWTFFCLCCHEIRQLAIGLTDRIRQLVFWLLVHLIVWLWVCYCRGSHVTGWLVGLFCHKHVCCEIGCLNCYMSSEFWKET